MLSRIVAERYGQFTIEVHGTQVDVSVINRDRRVEETFVRAVVSVAWVWCFTTVAWVGCGGGTAFGKLGLNCIARVTDLSKVNGVCITNCGAWLWLVKSLVVV
ncbi:hypothetical protein [Bowdeniella nasicola]|uniref:hypothetical protein n=1 Tax=Bowdeniella nasicola TaxID=208480 RepID=UPI001C9E36FA|nr:hypothetical protein [Bowdeniella nasicola]